MFLQISKILQQLPIGVVYKDLYSNTYFTQDEINHLMTAPSNFKTNDRTYEDYYLKAFDYQHRYGGLLPVPQYHTGFEIIISKKPKYGGGGYGSGYTIKLSEGDVVVTLPCQISCVGKLI